jgi:hypothetical protein
MSLASLVTQLTTLLAQAQTLIPFIAGFALLIGGGILALGNHSRGKEAIVCAFLGTAVMLASATIGASLHA